MVACQAVVNFVYSGIRSRRDSGLPFAVFSEPVLHRSVNHLALGDECLCFAAVGQRVCNRRCHSRVCLENMGSYHSNAVLCPGNGIISRTDRGKGVADRIGSCIFLCRNLGCPCCRVLFNDGNLRIQLCSKFLCQRCLVRVHTCIVKQVHYLPVIASCHLNAVYTG